ncbi:DNA replication/repair protein RecF [soil metagenome]
MHVVWIAFTDYRSYPSLRWQPEDSVNLLSGPNGAGKTNVLEGIAYMASLRSFRGVSDEGLIADEAERGYIRGGVARQDSGEALIEIELARVGGRRAQVDRQRLRRTSDLIEVLRVVTFLPEDLDIVKRGPGYRRAVIDEAAALVRPSAAADFAEYDRALRQRNAFLRQGHIDAVTLGVWEERLSQAGGKVMARRAWILSHIAPHMTQAYRAISGSQSTLTVDYESEWGGVADPELLAGDHGAALAERLEQRRRHDIERRVTTVGPHRDEPRLLLDDYDTRIHGSQGEQRTTALAIRLAVHAVVSELSGVSPVLLLDDVFSELDNDRSRALAVALPATQTFITTARPEDVPLAGRHWQVGVGAVTGVEG